MSNSDCIIEELSMSYCNRDEQAKNHMQNFVVSVRKGLKRVIDIVKAMGSVEAGVTCEEPDVLELDEYAEDTANTNVNLEGCEFSVFYEVVNVLL